MPSQGIEPLQTSMTEAMLDLAQPTAEKVGLPISPAQGLVALKAIWSASNRLAELQDKHPGERIPLSELFGALLGVGEAPDPLAAVKQQLEEINAKLDRVLAGIQEIQQGLVGMGVLAVYLNIADSIFLIESYSESLPSYLDGTSPAREAERKDFVDKLLGTKNERDGVPFCAQKIVKLSSLLFDLAFPYIAANVRPETAREVFLRGAFAFRVVTDVLLKGMLLELAATASASDPTKKDAGARAEKVTRKYHNWLRTMIDRSFLPFAERLATLNFRDEFLGMNDTRVDACLPLPKWTPAPSSILRDADELAAKLMGRSRSATLRAVPNIPPLADTVPAHRGDYAFDGTFHWEVTQRPATTFTKIKALEKMLGCPSTPFFQLNAGTRGFGAAHISIADISFLDGAEIPPGFEKSKLQFARYEFDLTGAAPGTQITVTNTQPSYTLREFPRMETRWQRYSVERGGARQNHESTNLIQYVMSESQGAFPLPAEGQLSIVLVTYAYYFFGQK